MDLSLFSLRDYDYYSAFLQSIVALIRFEAFWFKILLYLQFNSPQCNASPK